MRLRQLVRNLLGPETAGPPEISVAPELAVGKEALDRWSRDSTASAFAVAEYVSLREESLNARVAMQHILQWGLAGYALIFAAGLSLEVGDQQTFLVRQFVFGVTLPAYAAAWAAVWVGEAKRMMRVGLYLRGRESQANEHLQPQELIPIIYWETWLSRGESRIRIGIYAPLILFSGALGLSVAVALLGMDPDPIELDEMWRRGGPFPDLPAAVTIVFAGTLTALYCAVLFFSLKKDRKRESEIIDIEASWKASR